MNENEKKSQSMTVATLEKELWAAYELTLAHLQNLKTNYGDRTVRLLMGGAIGYQLGLWTKEPKRLYLIMTGVYVIIMAIFEWFLWAIRKRAIERDIAIRKMFGWCSCGRYHPNLQHSKEPEKVTHGRDVIEVEAPQAVNVRPRE